MSYHDNEHLTGELNTLLNGVMQNKLINSPTAIDPTSGIICSDVEDVSTYLEQGHLVWINMGQIIRMLPSLRTMVKTLL